MSIININLTKENMLWPLFGVYLIAISFLNIYFFKVISIPEFVFIFLGVCFIFQLKNVPSVFKNINYVELFIGLLLMIYFIGAVLTLDDNAIKEFLGLTYLVSFYIIIKWMLNENWNKTFLYLLYGLSIAGAISTILGIYGVYIAYMEHIPNGFAWYYLDYPYLGNIPRARGLLGTPEMMAHLLSISLIISLGYFYEKKQFNLFWLFIIGLECVGLLITFSKTILIMLIIVLLFMFFKNSTQWIRIISGTVGIIILIGYLFGTHVVIHTINNRKVESGDINKFSPIPAMSSSWNSTKTSYYDLKMTAIKTGLEHPFFGIKGTSFNEYNAETPINIEGQSKISYDPHCTYLGAFAAYGFPGLLISVSLFLVTLYYSVKKYYRTLLTKDLIVMLLVVFLMIEAINTDILNFRLLWIIIAMVSFDVPRIRFSYSVLTTEPNDRVV